MTFHDLVHYGVEFGDVEGAKYIELRYVQSVTEGYSTRNGEILTAGSTETAGIGIRVLANGGIGFVSTAKLEKPEIERAVKTAIKLARASKRKVPLILSDEPSVQTTWKVPVRTAFADISSETKLARVLEVDKTLMDKYSDETLPYRLILLALETQKKFIATNEGTQVESDSSLARYFAMLTAKGEKTIEQRGFMHGSTGGWEWVESPKFIQTFLDEAGEIKEIADKARPMTFETPIDVIVGAEVAGIMAHENCGHPCEADRIQGREGMNAGESFWMDIDVGTTRVGSPAVTVIDDPTIPKSGGFYIYDDEGVKAKPRYLIKNGIANEMLHDRLSAGKMGAQSNGSARATNYNREPIPRMANTYIAPGDHSFEELIEDIKFGMFMKSFSEWNIDDRRYQSKYVGLYARVIRDGEITNEFIHRPVLELTSRGLFGAVDACSKGFNPDTAICGKSDPGQGIPVWTAGPDSMRLRSIQLGGMPA
ncbi:MAG: TldD/PmbA family protein [Candidatus Thorarchaeota archaeon]